MLKRMGILVNPTGGTIRNDTQGAGYWQAPRGQRLHRGVDFDGEPGQIVVAPCGGEILRVVYPYADDMRFEGVRIRNERLILRLYYVRVSPVLVSKEITAGQPIGELQDIRLRYGKDMKPHAHLEVEAIDPLLLL